MLTAVLGAVVGAVVGAVCTAPVTIWVTQHQIAAAQQQSDHSFQRQQRFDAYKDLIDADVDLQRYESDCVDEISTLQGITPLPRPDQDAIANIHKHIKDDAAPRVQAAATKIINGSVGASAKAVQDARDLVTKEDITVSGMLGQSDAAYGQQSADLNQVKRNIDQGFAAFRDFSRDAWSDN